MRKKKLDLKRKTTNTNNVFFFCVFVCSYKEIIINFLHMMLIN